MKAVVNCRGWRALAMRALGVVCAVASPALADRPVHGSIGGGGSLLLTGAQGDHWRYELEVDLKPRSRFGGFVAWRAFDDTHDGMLLGGIVYEAGAARPLLVIDLHGDVGADLDQRVPVIGGGVRTTLTLWKAFGIAFDGGGYLVIDDVDDTRFVIATSTSAVLRW